jgi:hypothetical protein
MPVGATTGDDAIDGAFTAGARSREQDRSPRVMETFSELVKLPN